MLILNVSISLEISTLIINNFKITDNLHTADLFIGSINEYYVFKLDLTPKQRKLCIKKLVDYKHSFLDSIY